MALRSPYQVAMGHDNVLDGEIELQTHFVSVTRGVSRHHWALKSLADSPILNNPENWWESFERSPSDYRGLNAALRGDTRSDYPLPWATVDRGVQYAGKLVDIDRDAWLARIGFWGRCYTTMGDEVRRRASFRDVSGVGQANAMRALTGLTLNHLGGYLTQVDRLRGVDVKQSPAAPQLIDDMICGAQSLYTCFKRAGKDKDNGGRARYLSAQRMFEGTARRLDREIVP